MHAIRFVKVTFQAAATAMLVSGCAEPAVINLGLSGIMEDSVQVVVRNNSPHPVSLHLSDETFVFTAITADGVSYQANRSGGSDFLSRDDLYFDSSAITTIAPNASVDVDLLLPVKWVPITTNKNHSPVLLDMHSNEVSVGQITGEIFLSYDSTKVFYNRMTGDVVHTDVWKGLAAPIAVMKANFIPELTIEEMIEQARR
jgi:hypothetical protein